MFTVGKIYNRRVDLHMRYGGQQYGGIATPSLYPIIMMFTGDSGQQHGYADGWNNDGTFTFYGEGQNGNMLFNKGNLAIRNHVQNAKTLYLFASATSGHCRYIGQMVCTGYKNVSAPDTDGHMRLAIAFELSPIALACDKVEEPSIEVEDLEVLRRMALDKRTDKTEPIEAWTTFRRRSAAIKKYALARANETCESCGLPGPFKSKLGPLFLEVHHLTRLADDGPDAPDAVLAICPNCHRRAHYSADAITFNLNLLNIAADIESKRKKGST